MQSLPADVALAKLREKVSTDNTLDSAIRTAFIADLDAQNPTTLTNLIAALAREGKANEAVGAQSK